MIDTSIDDSSTAAAEVGQICAVAARAQRDAWKWMRRYRGMFAGEADSALLNSVCLASAFGAPRLTSAELRVTNRAALWAMAVAARGDVRPRDCLAVADGAPGEDDLTRPLADIRDELTPMPAFPALRPRWREELRLLLDGRPAAGFCAVSHWIATAEHAAIPALSGGTGEQPLIRYLESQVEFWGGFSRGEP